MNSSLIEHEELIIKYGEDYTQYNIDKEVHEQENDWCLQKAFTGCRFYQ